MARNRKPMNKKLSRKVFRSQSNPHPRNATVGVMRGGTRL